MSDIRHWMQILESDDPLDVPTVIGRELQKTGMSPRECNDGYCWFVADKVVQQLGRGRAREESEYPSGYFGTNAQHTWVEVDGRHYDVETPRGVNDPRQLGYFRRMRRNAERRKAKGLTENTPATVKLTDLYDEDELTDPREMLYNYVDEDDLNREFVVHTMTPQQALTYKTPRDDMTVYEAFKQFAGKDQKRFVREKATHYDQTRIIVTMFQTVIDGNHHLVAGILAKQPVRYINLADQK